MDSIANILESNATKHRMRSIESAPFARFVQHHIAFYTSVLSLESAALSMEGTNS